MAAKFQADAPAASSRIINVIGDAAYVTGGYSTANFSDQENLVGLNTGAVIALYDAANKKVKFITAATGAEVANASDQSAVTVKLLAYS